MIVHTSMLSQSLLTQKTIILSPLPLGKVMHSAKYMILASSQLSMDCSVQYGRAMLIFTRASGAPLLYIFGFSPTNPPTTAASN